MVIKMKTWNIEKMSYHSSLILDLDLESNTYSRVNNATGSPILIDTSGDKP